MNGWTVRIIIAPRREFIFRFKRLKKEKGSE